MRPDEDPDAARRRHDRRRYALGLEHAALHARDDDELRELEQLVTAERLGFIELPDAHAALNALLREQTARRTANEPSRPSSCSESSSAS